MRCGEGHAEVNAFRSVRSEDEHLLSEATVYVSLEPCSHHGKTPPCADLIVRKGVRRVVCGCVDPFSAVQGRGIERIRKAGIDVTVGVLEQECLMLNREFIVRNTENRPYILLKWAQTANGFMGYFASCWRRKTCVADFQCLHKNARTQAPCRARCHSCGAQYRRNGTPTPYGKGVER